MEKFSYSTFGVARTLMALAVFFCHVFDPFNYFGFLFVSVFFFMSGFGMEMGHKRFSSLTRLVPYLGLFAAFTCLYFALFGVFPYPTSWFLVVYFVVMVLYRLLPNLYALALAFCLFALCLIAFGFSWVWYASFPAFLFGLFVSRYPRYFTLKNCFYLAVLNFLIFVYVAPVLWGFLPLFIWFVLKISSISFVRPFAFLGQYTLLFYCSHCLFLGLFGATWTLGGHASFIPVFAGFVCTCLFSWVMKDGLFLKTMR